MVQRDGVVGQRYRVAAVRLRHLDGVVTACHDLEWQPGIDVGRQRYPVVIR